MTETPRLPIYEVRVRGQFAPRWSDAFHPLLPTACEGPVTVLRGCIPDQAALYSVLRRLECSGVVLLSLQCVAEPS